MRKYEVTLRRDIQQKLVVLVEAKSRQDAIDAAEAAATALDDEDWQVEEFIGAHRPKVGIARDMCGKCGSELHFTDQHDACAEALKAAVAEAPKKSKTGRRAG